MGSLSHDQPLPKSDCIQEFFVLEAILQLDIIPQRAESADYTSSRLLFGAVYCIDILQFFYKSI